MAKRQKEKRSSIQHRDLLKELYEKKITEKEAQKIWINLEGVNPYAQIGIHTFKERLGVNEVPFKVLAKWRYEGWPTTCAYCQKPCDMDKNEGYVIGKWRINNKIVRNFIMHKNDCTTQKNSTSIQHRDLLKEVYKKKITEKEAEKIWVHVEGPNKYAQMGIQTLKECLGVNEVSFKVLAKWRYEGWPTTCAFCKKPCDMDRNEGYIIRKWRIHNKIKRNFIIHPECITQENSGPIKCRDILKELYEKKITEKEAEQIWLDVEGAYFYEQIGIHTLKERLGVDRVSFKVLARWRYEGWPATCYLCKKPCDMNKNEGYVVRKWCINGNIKRNFLIHHTCNTDDFVSCF